MSKNIQTPLEQARDILQRYPHEIEERLDQFDSAIKKINDPNELSKLLQLIAGRSDIDSDISKVLVEGLLEEGANPHAENNDLKSAYNLANEASNSELARFMNELYVKPMQIEHSSPALEPSVFTKLKPTDTGMFGHTSGKLQEEASDNETENSSTGSSPSSSLNNNKVESDYSPPAVFVH